MKTIVKIKFGSHLYGTNTESSDLDYKGVFVPDYNDTILQRIPRSIQTNTKIGDGKNTSSDIDCEMYSIQHFMKLLQEGQTVAIDMLFAPEQNMVETSSFWRMIQRQRENLLSKNISAFTGYCKTQAAKHGIKGSRVAAVRSSLELISELEKKTRLVPVKWSDGYKVARPLYEKLADCFDLLPEGEHIEKYVCEVSKQPTYEVCGRKFQGSCKLYYVKNCLQQILDGYGTRALQAEKNENIDWKAISHAFRVCFEVKEMLETHNITFPLKEAEHLKLIKYGKLRYKEDNVDEQLESLMCEVEFAHKNSDLPEKAKQEVFDNIILKIYKDVRLEDMALAACPGCGSDL